MPGTAAVQGGAVPGLTLRAWALVNGGSGTLLKGFNVSSAVRNIAGDYNLNFQANMADTNVLLVLQGQYPGIATPGQVQLASVSVSTINYQTRVGTTAQDVPGNHWIGVYG